MKTILFADDTFVVQSDNYLKKLQKFVSSELKK